MLRGSGSSEVQVRSWRHCRDPGAGGTRRSWPGCPAPAAGPATRLTVRQELGERDEGPDDLHDMMYLVSQGFDGLPIVGSRIFGDSFYYNETVAYVGVVAVRARGPGREFRLRRRPEVRSPCGHRGARWSHRLRLPCGPPRR